MAQHLIPSAATLKAIKPGDARRRLSDGAGLYLLLFVKGGSHGWRLDYTFQGRRKTLSLGTYPATSLSAARLKAEEARTMVGSGTDPSKARRQQRHLVAKQLHIEKLVDAGLPVPESFEAVAREWYAKHSPSWATSHADKIIRRLERDVFPWLGAKPISTLKPPELLQVLNRVEVRGAIETTHRVQQNCSQVFRYAVAIGLLESDPSRDLRGALPPWRPEHYPTLTDPRRVGQLLRDINAYEGGFITRCALKLSPLLFVRPGELRRAEWNEINLDAAEWRIPAPKMKGRVMHIVPLATQALAVLRELKPLTGPNGWVFPGNRTNGEPMSENTVNAALRRLGYERATMTAHGFRGMASTMLHEIGWASDVVERQLSHAERNSVKAAYNHAEHLPERRRMMQAWADHLDQLKQLRTVDP
ncbi:tyrosine-type recombinase/integrase [Aquabacterium sp.]|uniref:tyrosine-type recombinase/integrase n=1 Tax=Aquabacterium sp. TaxID=1872578 RepID=UPI002CBC83F4|nr:integrase arm-type DNA-binding domain-containing protein [Aquabacterium sp.]HSW09000.1 integrase arm-type DNA-binding domain-containing protein [Aquabacterium sp.]